MNLASVLRTALVVTLCLVVGCHPPKRLFTLKEAVDFLESDGQVDSLGDAVEAIYLLPPGDGRNSDIDEGDEDGGGAIDDLSGRQLSAPVEVVFASNDRLESDPLEVMSSDTQPYVASSGRLWLFSNYLLILITHLERDQSDSARRTRPRKVFSSLQDVPPQLPPADLPASAPPFLSTPVAPSRPSRARKASAARTSVVDSSDDTDEEEVENKRKRKKKGTSSDQPTYSFGNGDHPIVTSNDHFEFRNNTQLQLELADDQSHIPVEVQLFEKFFTDDVFQDIAERSMEYAHQNGRAFATTAEEVRVMFGILLVSGYVDVPARHHYWSEHADLHNAAIATAMRKNRFEEMLQNLHFANNTYLPANDR